MKSFLVIGLGRFGTSCAQALSEMNHEVLGVDEDARLVNNIAPYVTHAVVADCTNEEFLSTIGVNKFSACIVAIGDNQEASVMITVLLKEYGAKYIVAKAHNDLHAKVLSKIGADRIVLPEKDTARKLATNLCHKNIYDLVDISPDYSIISVKAPKPWWNKTLIELSPRDKFGINIIAIESSEDNINVLPNANTIIHDEDVLVVVGKNTELEKIKKL
ncbi:MAG: TrkA family potassium uptake protein [Clostridia bacterium]|nr:TrkA family potassium uptake protein [Clostridia bacterium]